MVIQTTHDDNIIPDLTTFDSRLTASLALRVCYALLCYPLGLNIDSTARKMALHAFHSTATVSQRMLTITILIYLLHDL